MPPSFTMDDDAKATLETLFRMCRDNRLHQQDVSDLARKIPLDFRVAKRVIGTLEREGYVETLTFGQKIALTDAGIVLAQRLLK